MAMSVLLINILQVFLIFFAHAQKRKFLFRGVRWHTKNAYVPYQAFIPHFSMLALTNLSISSFALMQKNQKIKALMPSLKMDCVPLKCLNLLRLRLRFGQKAFLTLHSIHFLNAHASMPLNSDRQSGFSI